MQEIKCIDLPTFFDETLAYCRRPEAALNLFDFIAQGGTLARYCGLHRLSPTMMYQYIHQNSERLALYREAVEAKEAKARDAVIHVLTSVLAADTAEAFNADGSMKPLNEFPPELAKALKSAKVKYDPETGKMEGELTVESRIDAALALARVLGMLPDTKGRKR